MFITESLQYCKFVWKEMYSNVNFKGHAAFFFFLEASCGMFDLLPARAAKWVWVQCLTSVRHHTSSTFFSLLYYTWAGLIGLLGAWFGLQPNSSSRPLPIRWIWNFGHTVFFFGLFDTQSIPR